MQVRLDAVQKRLRGRNADALARGVSRMVGWLARLQLRTLCTGGKELIG